MKYLEYEDDDYVIILINTRYFCLPLFIYTQIPLKSDIVTYKNKLKGSIYSKTDKAITKLLKIKRTRRLE